MFDKLKKPKKDKHKDYDKYATKRFIDTLDDLDKENCVDEEEEQINDLLSTIIFGYPGIRII